MTRLTGLDKKDEHHLLVQDLLVIIPVEMVRLYFKQSLKKYPFIAVVTLFSVLFSFGSRLWYWFGWCFRILLLVQVYMYTLLMTRDM